MNKNQVLKTWKSLPKFSKKNKLFSLLQLSHDDLGPLSRAQEVEEEKITAVCHVGSPYHAAERTVTAVFLLTLWLCGGQVCCSLSWKLLDWQRPPSLWVQQSTHPHSAGHLPWGSHQMECFLSWCLCVTIPSGLVTSTEMRSWGLRGDPGTGCALTSEVQPHGGECSGQSCRLATGSINNPQPWPVMS